MTPLHQLPDAELEATRLQLCRAPGPDAAARLRAIAEVQTQRAAAEMDAAPANAARIAAADPFHINPGERVANPARFAEEALSGLASDHAPTRARAARALARAAAALPDA